MSEKILKATHSGQLHIGETAIDAYVLEDGTRVLSYRGVNRALGGSESWSTGGATKLAPFLSKKVLKPYISEEISAPLSSPIEFQPPHGGRTAFSVPATLLPQICDVWLKARADNKLKASSSLRS